MNPNFAGKRILVMGDVMVDRYIFADVSRISPEAPVPVAHVQKEEWFLGGAANVAANIRTLGGECSIIGLVGDDEAGSRFTQLCDKAGIDASGIIKTQLPTTLKSRVIGGNQQLLRLDHEQKTVNPYEDAVLTNFEKHKSSLDLVIVSDYAKGFVTSRIMEHLKRSGVKILVDPKPENFAQYNDVFLIKCNRVEATAVTKMADAGEMDSVAIGMALVSKTHAHILYTRGKDGMSLFEREGAVTHIPSHAKEVYDVSGAGDTAMAALALGIASGATLCEAAIIANHAAGIKCAKMGTSPVTINELTCGMDANEGKIKEWDELERILGRYRNAGKKIVFTNGCFDILHPGHTTLLRKSKEYGDILVLGLNTDASVSRLKGPSRPVVNQHDRAEVLAALSSVDYVTFFDEDTPLRLIELVKPDVLVKGGDYVPATIVGNDFVAARGGKTVIINLVDGKSTTNIVNRMQA